MAVPRPLEVRRLVRRRPARRRRAFLADSQVPWDVAALGGVVTEPAWRSKPAFYLVATNDHMIPPPAQRTMAARVGAVTTEAIGSHAVYVSQPGAVADLIRQAANTARCPLPHPACSPDVDVAGAFVRCCRSNNQAQLAGVRRSQWMHMFHAATCWRPAWRWPEPQR
ncbi:alpha/beta fold hydrolase [Micromonospora eburnea]|uniref:alpha/beta fold hydrolase n=1 Tax=Micromonospora eburnea TaxID=227316 RepID=UPI00363BCB47